MAQGPVLIFDKSTIQTLTLDEAVLLDNFYRSNIVPVFFVECVADLVREMRRMKSTPEQLVGALAEKTPDMQACANVFHLDILKGELSRQWDMNSVILRPVVPPGQQVHLGDSQGIIFKAGPEEEALNRWSHGQFIDLERQTARLWRKALDELDLKEISRTVRNALGPWRKPKSITDARLLTDLIIDNLDPEFVLRFGMDLLRVPEATGWVINNWIENRRKPLRDWVPYFIHLLSINIFFSLVVPTELLKNVKPSHHIDLAYLYYLPFCAVFTSRDNFHVQIAPLFMTKAQTFVHGDDLQKDLNKLHLHYMALPEAEREKGIFSFAAHPPDDSSFLTSRLWDIYLPAWRQDSPYISDVPDDIKNALKELIDKFRTAKPIDDADEPNMDDMGFVEISRQVKMTKRSYLRFSRDVIDKNIKNKTTLETNQRFTSG